MNYSGSRVTDWLVGYGESAMVTDRFKKMLAARPSSAGGAIDEAVGLGKRLVSARCDATLELADGLISEDKPAQALQALIATDGTWANGRPILRRIVQVALALGDFEKCTEALDRLIELSPDDPALHMQRTVVANQTGDAFLFWRSLHQAHDIYFDQAKAGEIAGLCGLLATRTRMGDREGAADVLRVVVAEAHRRPTGDVIVAAADALIATGDRRGLAYLADGIDPGQLDDVGRVEYADLLVRLERTADAIATINQLEPKSKKRAELLAWSAMQNGDIEQARALTDRYRFPNTIDHLRVYSTELALDLEPVEAAPGQLDGPIVITMTRNEIGRMPQFFEHYRGLGFKNFLAIDNQSNDGTLEFLVEQPDTHVFTTSGDFRKYASGRRWVNHLIDNHGAQSWNFVVDADELLVFPKVDLGIDQLTARLDATDAQVMFGLAVDMHGERLDAWGIESEAPLVERFPYFDARTELIGSRHAPYLSVAGGLRNQQLARVMPENLLTKPIAVRGGHGVKFLNPHLTNPARPADITAVVLHFKFALDPHERIGVNSAKGVFMQYLAQDISATRNITLMSEHSTRYESPQQLIDMGLLREPST